MTASPLDLTFVADPTIAGVDEAGRGPLAGPVVAAASILAKTVRDGLMLQYAEQFPAYGFERHMGYGTAVHMAALREHGPCEIHRRSFAPVARVIKGG